MVFDVKFISAKPGTSVKGVDLIQHETLNIFLNSVDKMKIEMTPKEMPCKEVISDSLQRQCGTSESCGVSLSEHDVNRTSSSCLTPCHPSSQTHPTASHTSQYCHTPPVHKTTSEPCHQADELIMKVHH